MKPWEQYQSAGAAPEVAEGPWTQFQAVEAAPDPRDRSQYNGLPRGGPGMEASLANVGKGAESAFDRAALGIKGLLPKSVQEAGDAFDRWRGNEPLTKQTARVKPENWTGDVGAVGADVAMTAPAMALGGPAAAAAIRGAGAVVPRLPAALRMAERVAQGSLPGRAALATASAAPVIAGNAALGAAISPDDERQQGAIAGAAGGALGLGVQRLAGGLLNPLMTREARMLADDGMVPTIGQSLGSATNRLEQKLTSLPIAGDLIAHARGRTLQDFNRNLASDVAQTLPQAVRQRVANAGTQDEALLALRAGIGNRYETALDSIPALRVEPDPIIAATMAAVDDPALALNRESQQRVMDYVQRNLLDRQGTLTGPQAKRIESDLGAAAYRFSTSAVGEERALGQAFQAIHHAWRDSLTDAARTAHPEAATALREADAAYRAFLPLDRAAAGSAAQQRGGAATPVMLRNSMAALDKSANDRALRTRMVNPAAQHELGLLDNAAPYDRLAARVAAGVDTLGSTIPDSGTAGRLMWGAGASGVAGAVGALPQVLAIAGVTAAAYSRLGNRLLQTGVAPETTAEVLRWAARQGLPEDVALNALPNVLAAYQRQTQN